MSDGAVFKVDKSKWPEGPWLAEADKVSFEHAGFPCLIVRHPRGGHLCGYLAVPSGHSWHGKDMDDVGDLDVHGGVTYADKCHGEVCHVAKAGEPDDVWWLGFDYAHSGDISPGWDLGGLRLNHWDRYSTLEDVERECRRAAEQAAAAR